MNRSNIAEALARRGDAAPHGPRFRVALGGGARGERLMCPRCEMPILHERVRASVAVDVCWRCDGIWLDRGELEMLLARAVRERIETASDAHRLGRDQGDLAVCPRSGQPKRRWLRLVGDARGGGEDVPGQ